MFGQISVFWAWSMLAAFLSSIGPQGLFAYYCNMRAWRHWQLDRLWPRRRTSRAAWNDFFIYVWNARMFWPTKPVQNRSARLNHVIWIHFHWLWARQFTSGCISDIFLDFSKNIFSKIKHVSKKWISGGASGQTAKLNMFHLSLGCSLILSIKRHCLVKHVFHGSKLKHSCKGIWDFPTLFWAFFLLGGHHFFLFHKK